MSIETMYLLKSWNKFVDIFVNPGLQRNALLLATATMISGLGSLVYWKIITLRFSADTVGYVSAGIASATFLASVSNLGLTAGLVRFLPGKSSSSKASLIRFSVWCSLIAAGIICVIFLGGRNLWAPRLIPPQASLLYLPFFIVLLLSIVQMNMNSAVIQAERKFVYLIEQSMIIDIIQISGAILIVKKMGVTSVLFTYVLPISIVAIGFSFLLPRIGRYKKIVLTFDRRLNGELIRYSLGTQIFSITWQLPGFMFPLFTLMLLGPEASAGFGLTWYAYSFLVIVPNAIIVALLVEGSHQPDRLRHSLWEALLTCLIVLTPLIVFITIFAPLLLAYFGNFYVRASMLLRLMTISLIPVSINGLYITFLRVRKEMRRLNLFASMLIFGSIALAYILVRQFGLDGIGWGWLLGQTFFSLASMILILQEHRLTLIEAR